jgi:hypothetical protein
LEIKKMEHGAGNTHDAMPCIVASPFQLRVLQWILPDEEHGISTYYRCVRKHAGFPLMFARKHTFCSHKIGNEAQQDETSYKRMGDAGFEPATR